MPLQCPCNPACSSSLPVQGLPKEQQHSSGSWTLQHCVEEPSRRQRWDGAGMDEFSLTRVWPLVSQASPLHTLDLVSAFVNPLLQTDFGSWVGWVTRSVTTPTVWAMVPQGTSYRAPVGVATHLGYRATCLWNEGDKPCSCALWDVVACAQEEGGSAFHLIAEPWLILQTYKTYEAPGTKLCQDNDTIGDLRSLTQMW